MNNNNIGYILENMFSFHTLEFEMNITKKEIRMFKKYIKDKGIKYKKEDKGDYRFKKYSIYNNSVRVFLYEPLEFKKGKYLPYRIKLIINPRNLINEKADYFGIFNNSIENIELLLKRLDTIPEQIGLKGYKFNEIFNLTRIDLCTNYIFHSKEITDIIFKLMKRGDHIEKMERKLYYDKVAKRKKPSKDEIKLYGDSVSINIYDKLGEMQNNDKTEVLSQNSFAGFIRFEVIWNNKKLSKLRKQYPQYNSLRCLLKDINIHSYLNIEKYVKKLFKTGTYFTVEGAKVCINDALKQNSIRSKTADKMFELIYEVQKKGSYYEAVKDNPKHLKLENKFEEIGLNPITIPIRWGQKCLPSVYSLLGFDDEEKKKRLKEEMEMIKIEALSIKEFYRKRHKFFERINLEEVLNSFDIEKCCPKYTRA